MPKSTPNIRYTGQHTEAKKSRGGAIVLSPARQCRDGGAIEISSLDESRCTPPNRPTPRSKKVQALQGASRYSTCGEYINDSVELDVITYKKARWGLAGLFGYMTIHDRANDVRG